MANTWMPSGVDGMMKGQIDLVNNTIKAVLVDSLSYTFSSAHANLSDVPSGSRKGTFTLSGKTVSGKVFNASNGNFPAVPAGGPYEYIYIYKDTGVESTSTLIIFIDTGSGLPVTGNNNDIGCDWNTGADKIGRLA